MDSADCTPQKIPRTATPCHPRPSRSKPNRYSRQALHFPSHARARALRRLAFSAEFRRNAPAQAPTETPRIPASTRAHRNPVPPLPLAPPATTGIRRPFPIPAAFRRIAPAPNSTERRAPLAPPPFQPIAAAEPLPIRRSIFAPLSALGTDALSALRLPVRRLPFYPFFFHTTPFTHSAQGCCPARKNGFG